MMAGLGSSQGPWMITPDERTKHEATFLSLSPLSGFLSGSQAKQFFLKSKLPPMVLGEIWCLSDLDRDGKMTMQEFTVAMHLIQNKLKGIDLPSSLPNSLKMTSMPTTHPSPKAGNYSPRSISNGFTSMSGGATQPNSSGTSWSGINQPMSTAASYMSTSMNALGSLSSSFNMGSTGFSNTNTTNVGFYNSPGIMSSSVQSNMPMNQVSTFPTTNQSTGNTISPAAKLKYNQMFKNMDFMKTGFLSGEQARAVLIQSGLSQQALAKIWSLSDLDKDSQLNIDEFSLAMHFVEMAKQGQPLPVTTPLELLTPAQSRIHSDSIGSDSGRERSSSNVSVDGRSRSGSVADDKRNIFTFEDKRKQNFEKGRLELERRRQDLQDKLKRERDEREAKERAEEERRQRAKMEAEQKRQAELEKQRHQQLEMEKEQEALKKKMIQQRLAAQIEAERQRQLEWQKRKKEELLNQKGLEQDIVNNLKTRKKNLDDDLASAVGKKTAAQQSYDKEQQLCLEAQTSYNSVHQNKEMRVNEISRIQCEIKEYQQRLAALSNERERVSLELNRMDTSKLSEAHGNATVSLQDTKGAIKRKQTAQNNLEKELNDRLREVDSLNSQLKDVQNSIQQLTEENTRLQQITESKQRDYTLWKQKKDEEDRLKKDNELKLRREEEESRKQKEREQEAMRLEQEKQRKEQELRRRMQEAQEAEARRKDQQLLTKDKIVVQQQQTLVSSAIKKQEASVVSHEWSKSSQQITITKPEKKQETVTPRPRPRPTIKKNNLEYYKVMFTFEPRNPDEMLIEEDQIVIIDPETMKAPPGWLKGKCGDKIGLFPENYVEKITEEEAKAGNTVRSPSPEVNVPQGSVKSLVASLSQQLSGGSISGGGSGMSGSSISGGGSGMSGGETSGGQLETASIARATQSATTTSPVDGNGPRSGGGTPAPQGLTAVALYPYREKKKGEVAHLSFNKGDIITIEEQQDMWWSGELNGKVGWFPKSYVKLQSTPKTNARTVQQTAVSNPTYDIPTVDLVVQIKQEDMPVLFECVALYPYTGEPTDLSFIQGDVISITKAEGDWWEGTLRGHSGLFPANYVKKVENEGSAAAKSKPEIGTVITPYTATTPDQLSLAPGQLIRIIKRDPSGWWDGELQARGKKRQSGIFPSNHVKLLSKSPNITPTSSGRTTPQPADVSSTYDVLPISKTLGQAKLEQVLAMFPYTAQNQDELTFYKGSVINVIEREGDWWKGEMNGQVGMFPSNYVQALSDLPAMTTQSQLLTG